VYQYVVFTEYHLFSCWRHVYLS